MNNKMSQPHLRFLLIFVFASVFCHPTFSFADSESTAILSNSPVAFYQLNETGNPGSGSVVAVDSGSNNFSGNFGTSCRNGYNNIAGPQPPVFSGFAATNWAVQTS